MRQPDNFGKNFFFCHFLLYCVVGCGWRGILTQEDDLLHLPVLVALTSIGDSWLLVVVDDYNDVVVDVVELNVIVGVDYYLMVVGEMMMEMLLLMDFDSVVICC